MADAALAPFTRQIGWQGFAYGVTGKIIVVYAKNFISQYNSSAAEAAADTEDDIEDAKNE